MFGLEEAYDEKISTRKDAQPSRTKFDKETVDDLKKQFLRFEEFQVFCPKLEYFSLIENYACLM